MLSAPPLPKTLEPTVLLTLADPPELPGLSGGEPVGRFGRLFRFTDTATGSPRLVKVGSATEIGAERDALAQLAEVRGIAHLVDHHSLSDGRAALVTEFVVGTTIAEMIAAGARPWDRSVRIVLAFAKILGAVHAREIIHGGIRPDHLILGGEGPAVVEFSYAVKAGAPYRATGAQVDWACPRAVDDGCPAWPEQDVHALANVLLGLIVGETTGHSAEVRALDRSADVPTDLAQIIKRVLADTGERQSTMAEFSAALAGVLARTLYGVLDQPVPSAPPAAPVELAEAPQSRPLPAASVAADTRADAVHAADPDPARTMLAELGPDEALSPPLLATTARPGSSATDQSVPRPTQLPVRARIRPRSSGKFDADRNPPLGGDLASSADQG
ncbi:MAG: hypothetical protein LBG11_06215, partial [Bifidobacteriaceae bacterium]|nr:hypothetical protein [Bifidobacteriaceae bacterium]